MIGIKLRIPGGRGDPSTSCANDMRLTWEAHWIVDMCLALCKHGIIDFVLIVFYNFLF